MAHLRVGRVGGRERDKGGDSLDGLELLAQALAVARDLARARREDDR